MLETAVKELENKLLKLNDLSYDSIDSLMRKIMKRYDLTAKELHVGFVNKHHKTPDAWIKKKMKKLQESKDHEGSMARTELEIIKRGADVIRKKIKKDDQELPAWIQSKITKAADYIQTASGYMQSSENIDEEGLSFEINPEQAGERRQRELKASLPNPSGMASPQVVEESITEKLIAELQNEHCGCEEEPASMKGHKKISEIANKHGVPKKAIEAQLKMGMEVEKEHTRNADMAMDIALQHLQELPDYYTQLKKMEKQQNESVVIHDANGNPIYEFIDLIRPDSILEGRKRKYPKGTCWTGYEQRGMKTLNGKKVPNCVAIEESKHSKRRKKRSKRKRTKSGDRGLHDWFNKSKSSTGKKGWVQLGGKWAGKPCARQPGQTSTPKCGSSKMARNMSADEEDAARRRKNRQDPDQPLKTGAAKPTYVKTEIKEAKDRPRKGSGTKDACYHKVKSRYSVWPSAYASGALSKCRKVGAANWGNQTEETLPTQHGQVIIMSVCWRGKNYPLQMFFPQSKVPGRKEIQFEVEKIYPGARLLFYKIGQLQQSMPLIQIQNSPSKNYLLNNGTIGEEIIKEFKSAAWTREEGKNPEGGLNKKGIAAYRRENPGSKLSLAVTTDPKKLKKGSKRAKRRLSFCRRMKGMKKKLTSAKTARDPNSRINLSLRKWNCE